MWFELINFTQQVNVVNVRNKAEKFIAGNLDIIEYSLHILNAKSIG